MSGRPSPTLVLGPTTMHRVASVTAGKLQRQVFGYFYPSAVNPDPQGDPPRAYQSWQFPLLSTAAFFALHVEWDGTVAHDDAWTAWNSSNMGALIATAHAAGTKVVVAIDSFDGSTQSAHDQFCGALDMRAGTVTQIVNEIKAKGVDGVNVDYEGTNPTLCPGGSDPTAMLTDLVAKLRAQLPEPYQITVSTYASGAESNNGAFDLPGMNPNVDAYFIMAYDMNYSQAIQQQLGCGQECLAPTAALASYAWSDTRAINEYIAAGVPASKIILGIPYYGYGGCVNGTGNNVPPNGVVQGSLTAIDYIDAAAEHSYPPNSQFVSHTDNIDTAGQERWDTWTTPSCPQGQSMELYWDDANSIGKKYDLINRAGLAGVGLFTLSYGGGSSELWDTIASHFTTLPGPPLQPAADAGDGSALVSWNAPSVNGSAISSYTVVANPGGQTVTVNGGQRWARMSGLTDGASYTFAISATNSYGTGPTSVSTNSVTPSSAARHLSYFAEGTTKPGFQEFVTLANSSSVPATTTLEYEYPAGLAPTFQAVAIGANSRATVDVNQTIGAWHDVSVVVNSASPSLIAERPMYFNVCLSPSLCLNGGDVGAAVQPAKEWDFAEGYTGPGFQEYVTVANPSATATANVSVRYLFLGGGTGTTTLTIPPTTRSTLDVNSLVGPNQQVAIQLTSDIPTVAERPMYFNTCFTFCFDGGHVAAGAVPSTSMAFAEGHTGDGLTEYLVIGNPSGQAATVTATYQFGTGQGAPISKQYTVPASGRSSIHVDDEVGVGKDVSITLASSVPVVAERPMYFNFTRQGQTQNGGHDAVGVAPGKSWYFAEGFTGTGFQTLYSFLNPGSAPITVTLAYQGLYGSLGVHQVGIAGNSRVTVDAATQVPAWQDVSLAATSDQPFVAERPEYFSTCQFGFCFDGGSDATGVVPSS
jgi:spore germination protein YaaH